MNQKSKECSVIARVYQDFKLQGYVSCSIAHSNHSRLLCLPASEANEPDEVQDTVPVRPFGLSYFGLDGLTLISFITSQVSDEMGRI